MLAQLASDFVSFCECFSHTYRMFPGLSRIIKRKYFPQRFDTRFGKDNAFPLTTSLKAAGKPLTTSVPF